jgi:hypothetical protein
MTFPVFSLADVIAHVVRYAVLRAHATDRVIAAYDALRQVLATPTGAVYRSTVTRTATPPPRALYERLYAMDARISA